MAIGYFDVSAEKLGSLFKAGKFEVIGGLPDDAKLVHIRVMRTRAGAGGASVQIFRMVFESNSFKDQQRLEEPVHERMDK